MPPHGNEYFSPAQVAVREENLRLHHEAFDQIEDQMQRSSRAVQSGHFHYGFLHTTMSAFERRRGQRPLSPEDEREAQFQSEVLLERIQSLTRVNLATSATRRLNLYPRPLGCFQPNPRSWEFLKPDEFTRHPAFLKRKDRLLLQGDLQDINDFFVKFMTASLQLPQYYSYVNQLVHNISEQILDVMDDSNQSPSEEDEDDEEGERVEHLATESSEYEYDSDSDTPLPSFARQILQRARDRNRAREEQEGEGEDEVDLASPSTSYFIYPVPRGIVVPRGWKKEEVYQIKPVNLKQTPLKIIAQKVLEKFFIKLFLPKSRQPPDLDNIKFRVTPSFLRGPYVAYNSFEVAKRRRILFQGKGESFFYDKHLQYIVNFNNQASLEEHERKKKLTRKYHQKMRQIRFRLKKIQKEEEEAMKVLNTMMDPVIPIMLLMFLFYTLQFRACELVSRVFI